MDSLTRRSLLVGGGVGAITGALIYGNVFSRTDLHRREKRRSEDVLIENTTKEKYQISVVLYEQKPTEEDRTIFKNRYLVPRKTGIRIEDVTEVYSAGLKSDYTLNVAVYLNSPSDNVAGEHVTDADFSGTWHVDQCTASPEQSGNQNLIIHLRKDGVQNSVTIMQNHCDEPKQTFTHYEPAAHYQVE